MGIFDIKSVALVGASNKEGKVGNIILKNLISDFKGNIYPVNPNYTTIYNLKSYKSLLEIDKDVDTVIVSIPAESVPDIIREAGEKGIKLAIIISAGFSEVGRKDLEDKILEYSRKYNIRILGPNGMGIYDPYLGFDTFFVDPVRLKRPKRGGIALLSQSGAISMAVMEWIANKDIGVSKIISYGNKIDINEIDILKELKNDNNTRAIFIYMEGLKPNTGKEFLDIAKDINKPIIILKSGKSTRGSIAVSSHTASMAGDYEVYRNLFKQYRIFEPKNMNEFMIYLKTISYYL
ncbi:acetate--CoA ligase [ADP-forming] I subunit alpha [Nanobdella aerobiophila]|uniref:Acetate--CoA ligase [ADP-forming] I subunit alpha n=1 Tax=Nanobdella aerobiophila TaxID=2586965 RepID=A0A915SFH6_9ARCH|nr:CoA-binding protein [Nanobdella aerobiophila]BBL45750.1 acetate--CoA ligase [ADP-forming] I subunit alpha [Nanobdella aerobiophila]